MHCVEVQGVLWWCDDCIFNLKYSGLICGITSNLTEKPEIMNSWFEILLKYFHPPRLTTVQSASDLASESCKV